MNIKWLPTLLLTPLYIALVAIIYFFCLSLTPPLTINKHQIETPVISAGESLLVTWDITFHRSCHYHVDRYIKNGGLTHSETFDAAWPEGHEFRFNTLIPIPKTQHDGDYKIVTSATAICNIFDYVFPIHVIIPPIQFQVNNYPVGSHHLELLTDTVAPGQPIDIKFYLSRRRQCYSILSRFLFDSEGVLVYENSRQPRTDIGLASQIERMSLPILPTGEYTLKTVSNYQCSESIHIVPYNDLKITIK